MSFYNQRATGNRHEAPSALQPGSRRRGFALILVLWMIALAGLLLMAIGGKTAHDARRTQRQQVDAQISQWLTAGGMLVTQPGWLPAEADTFQRTVELPSDSPTPPTLEIDGERQADGNWQVRINVEHRDRAGEQIVTLTGRVDGVKMIRAERTR